MAPPLESVLIHQIYRLIPRCRVHSFKTVSLYERVINLTRVMW